MRRTPERTAGNTWKEFLNVRFRTVFRASDKPFTNPLGLLGRGSRETFAVLLAIVGFGLICAAAESLDQALERSEARPGPAGVSTFAPADPEPREEVTRNVSSPASQGPVGDRERGLTA